jgi:hypothetical protein
MLRRGFVCLRLAASILEIVARVGVEPVTARNDFAKGIVARAGILAW